MAIHRAFDTKWFSAQDDSFFDQLNKTKTPHLVLTAETDDFDSDVITQWREEGFDVIYEPLSSSSGEYIKRIHAAGDSFGVGERYAIMAYGEAASVILEAHLKPNNPRLCAIVAYYPSTIPSVHTRFPPSVKVLVHLAGTEVGVRQTSQVLGIQGKRRTVRKRVDPGNGFGESLRFGYQAYTYSNSEPGFAEHDLDEFDPIAASLAFSRSLTILHKGFRLESTLEETCDSLAAVKLAGRDEKTNELLRPDGHVLCLPTMNGVTGPENITKFYASFFHPIPSTFAPRLLSRTIGTDRVVDELLLSFKHSEIMPWILPGISPTHKKVEVVIVSILHIRGGKLESEHVYWDQASVLVQIGLLDAKLANSSRSKDDGIRHKPVVRNEGPRALRNAIAKDLDALSNDIRTG